MFDGLPLFPEAASTTASQVDALYFFLVALSVFFSVLIFTAVFVFAIRFRRRSESERPAAILGSVALELAWTLVPLGIVAVIFVWSAQLFFAINRVPPDAMEIYVVGKQLDVEGAAPHGPARDQRAARAGGRAGAAAR